MSIVAGGLGRSSYNLPIIAYGFGLNVVIVVTPDSPIARLLGSYQIEEALQGRVVIEANLSALFEDKVDMSGTYDDSTELIGERKHVARLRGSYQIITIQ